MPTRLPCLSFLEDIKLPAPESDEFNLEGALRQAARAGAQTLLLLAGQPPVLRVAGKLAPPLSSSALDWQTTQRLVEQLLPDEQRADFENNGSTDLPFHLAGVAGKLTIFYGNGCHNLIFHLTSGNGKKK